MSEQPMSTCMTLTHGLLARHIVPPNDPIEDPRVFEQLVDELYRRYQPRDIMEGLFVNRIAACYWRLDRAQRYESQCILGARLDSPPGDDDLVSALGLNDLPPGRGPEFFGMTDQAVPSAPDFAKLLRYEHMINRELRWTMDQFNQHRAEFSPNADPVPNAEPTPSPSLKSQISDLKSPPSAPPSRNPSVPPSSVQNEPTPPPLKSQISDPKSLPAPNEPNGRGLETGNWQLGTHTPSAPPRFCGSIPGAKRTQLACSIPHSALRIREGCAACVDRP